MSAPALAIIGTLVIVFFTLVWDGMGDESFVPLIAPTTVLLMLAVLVSIFV